MVYVLALGCALANALTSVLQRMGVEDAPGATTLRLSLMVHALRRRIWLLGFVLMVVSFVLQAIALHLGRLSEVQPVLTTELLFLVLILATWFRFTVGLREWLSALAAAGGLTGFLICARPEGGNLSPTAFEWVLVVAASVAAMTITVLAALRGPRWWRAAMFGSAGAVGFALTAAFTKVVTGYVAHDVEGIFRHWQTYALAVFGILAVFLTQNAYHAGPIAASQSTLVLIDPLASIVIGVGLFGDNLRTSGAWGPLEVLSLIVLFAGAVSLAQSPLVSGMKGDEDVYHEMLSMRSRSRTLPDVVVPPPLTNP